MFYGAGGLSKSYGEPQGRLWRYDPDGSLHEMATGFVCGNGVDWSPDKKKCKLHRICAFSISNSLPEVFMNDSVGQKIYSFDFDLESGAISNRKLLVDMAGTIGEPDGMVISTDGSLYIAVYGTNRVSEYHSPLIPELSNSS